MAALHPLSAELKSNHHDVVSPASQPETSDSMLRSDSADLSWLAGPRSAAPPHVFLLLAPGAETRAAVARRSIGMVVLGSALSNHGPPRQTTLQC